LFGLEDRLGRRQALEAHRAQVLELHLRRQLAAHLLGDRLRDEDLPAVRGVHDPRGAVDRAAEIVVVARLHQTGVQAATDAQPHPGGGRRVEQRKLDRHHRDHRVGR